jgi:hypothetical protein
VAEAEHSPGLKPWNQMTDKERADAYYEASTRLHNIDWYRFHGVDPRQAQSVGATS